ncbi:MAG: ATP-binding protein [Bacteroidia bacterium]
MKNCIYIVVFLLSVATANAQSSFLSFDEDDIVNAFDDAGNKGVIDHQLMNNEKKAFDKAVKTHEKNFQSAQRSSNKISLAIEASNLGFISLKKNDITNTLQYFEQALTIFKTTNSPRNEGLIYALTGYLYYKQKSDKDALDYFLPALKDAQAINSTKAVAILSAYIGKSYERLKDDGDAISSYNEAFAGFKKIGDKKSAAIVCLSLSESEIKFDSNDKALSHLNECTAAFEDLRDPENVAKSLRNTGIIYFKNEQYENAIDYFNRSLKKFSSSNVSKLKLDAYSKLSAANAVAKNNLKVQLYNNLYLQVKDSLDKSEKTKSLTGKQLLTEQEEKNLIADLLNNEKKIMNQKLSQKEIEYNKKITEAQIEQLKKEQTIAQLSDTIKVFEGDKQSREFRIQQLLTEKAQQELALSQQKVELKEKELTINMQRNLRNLFLCGIFFVAAFTGLLYYRYREKKKLNTALNKALNDLKATQTQLIQSEKMASLGQLTAGIAHEIQNPLNFVNNFSELSAELIDEAKTITDEEEKTQVIQNVKANLEKIVHHGKRADRIVKGMLLHSREQKGELVSVMLNQMIDEAATIAYHGMRAKNSDFQCAINKNFDPKINKVNLIPQDINRVIINLLNNAFYAAREKSLSGVQLPSNENENQNDSRYKPTVSISTFIKNGRVNISIKDNGSGIPNEITDKIFNPFFTTKPPGQGTGLGLSLSYDIINAHGGSLNVSSVVNEFTEFIISLPA